MGRRQRLDDMGPDKGTRLRVYFPHGSGPKVMVASGETRMSTNSRCEFDHRLVDASGAGDSEWVPGWYVAQATNGRGV